MIKWIARIVGVLLLLVVIAILYVEIKKDDLVFFAVVKANEQINGELSYEDADVSLLRSFPDVKVSLYNVELRDSFQREDKPLMEMGEISVDVDVISAVKKDLSVNSFVLKNGSIYTAIYDDESTNYDIMKPSETTSKATDFTVNDYIIEDVDVIYSDQVNGQVVSLLDTDMKGRLSYKNEYLYIINDLTTSINLAMGRMLPSYTLRLDGEIETSVSPLMDTISIKRSDFVVNDLPLRMDGTIINGEEIGYDIKFNSPSTEIKRLISLLPAFYKNSYENIITKGTYVLNGQVRGNTANDYPIYKISLMTDDANVSYPAANAKIDNLDFSLLAENNNMNTMYSKLVVDDINIRAAESSLIGDFTSLPEANGHDVGFDITADIDFDDVVRSLQLSDGYDLNGIIKGAIKGGAQITEAGDAVVISDQDFSADIVVDNLLFKTPAQSTSVKSATIKGDKEKLQFAAADILYGDAMDMDIKGFINDPLASLLDSAAQITGDITIESGLIDLDKLAGTDTATVNPAFDIPNLNINTDFTANRIIRGEYQLDDVTARGTLSNESARVDFAIGEFNGSRFDGRARLNNLLGYGLNSETLSGNVSLTSDKLNLDRFMMTGENGAEEAAANEEVIPSNIDLDIIYEAGQVQFKNIDLVKSLGDISIEDQKVIFKNRSDIFGGAVSLQGTFDAGREEGYHIDMSIDLTSLGLSQTASNLKIFNQLIPVAKFLQGEYSASLSWSSDLSDNYIPDFNSVTARGVIETKGGQINGLLPIDTFLNRFTILDKKPDPIKIKDASKFFIIEEGKILVKGIELRKGDITVALDGSHSFSQDLNYAVTIDVPKSQANVGNVIGFLQDKLKFSNKLKSAGENISVNINAFMGGKINKPTFSVKRIGLASGGQVESVGDVVTSTAAAVRDSVETTIRDTIGKVTDKVKGAVDSIRTKADSIRKRVETTADSLRTEIDSTLQVKKDEAKETGKDIIEDVVTGNPDSVRIKLDELFKENSSALDSLKKKVKLPFFPSKKKN